MSEVTKPTDVVGVAPGGGASEEELRALAARLRVPFLAAADIPEIVPLVERLSPKYLRHYVDAVQAAMDAGAIPHGDPYYAAQGILGMSNWIYTWFDSETNDAAAIAEQFIRLILGPAATPALLSSKDLMRCLAAVGAGTGSPLSGFMPASRASVTHLRRDQNGA